MLQTPATGWLTSLIDVASTPEGRKHLIDTMKEASSLEASDDGTRPSDVLRRRHRRSNVS
jgi:hypothetical protein